MVNASQSQFGLSQDVVAAYDSGFKSLPWRRKPAVTAVKPSLNLHDILKCADHAQQIQAIDRRDLYVALALSDQETALEVLPHTTPEQFVAFFDYDAWHDDRLSLQGASKWLKLLKHESNALMFQKFKELDEEYQIGLLNPYVQILDQDEFETLKQEEQDTFIPLPGQAQWYKIRNADQTVEDIITGLVEGGFEGSVSESVEYTLSLLQHASFMPPHEDEARLYQFRTARLEEDGFLTYEESLSLFAPFDGPGFLRTLGLPVESQQQTLPSRIASSERVFLDDVLSELESSSQFDDEVKSNVKSSIATLANMLASASRIAPDDLAALAHILEQSRGLLSVGLEVASQGDRPRAVTLLIDLRPKAFFQLALSMITSIRQSCIEELAAAGCHSVEQIRNYLNQGKFGMILAVLDTRFSEQLDLQALETLKGLFNRLPMIAREHEQRIVFDVIQSGRDINDLFTSVTETIARGKVSHYNQKRSIQTSSHEGLH